MSKMGGGVPATKNIERQKKIFTEKGVKSK